MSKKVVLGLLLLVGLVPVAGCLGQTQKPTATPTTRGTGLPTSTPIAATVNILAPTPTPCDDCPGMEQSTPPSIAADTPTPTLPPAPIPGRLAPDFTLPDLEGNEVRLSDHRGHVVLVNFWATW